MGFESFRVELRGGAVGYSEADRAVRALPHATPDPDALPSPGSAFYTVSDGGHVLEIEVADAPVHTSCRFTLCHPPSVVRFLLDVVAELSAALGMNARVCDEEPGGAARWFPPAEFAAFAARVTAAHAARRAEWVANFGPGEWPARTPEAFERFILPRCRPLPADPVAGR